MQSAETFDRDRLEACLTLTPPASAPVTPDPLGSEWMRNLATNRISGGGLHTIHSRVEAILAIPGPTDADLDRAALARPKVARLVEAVRKFNARVVAGEIRSKQTYREFCAALAALKEVE